MKANVIVFDLSILVISIAVFIGLRRIMGIRRANAFLLGSVVFSLAVYTASVVLGVQNFFWYAVNNYFNHYPVGGYTIWLGVVPLAAPLLWFTVAASSYLAAGALFEKKGTWSRCAAGGGFAVLFYLLIEPVAVTNHWWTWNLKSFYLIDVPALAWLSVFTSVFIFTFLFRVTVIERADPAVLKAAEDRTLRRIFFKRKESTAAMTWNQLRGLFLFRLVAGLAVFGAVSAPLAAVLWALANRGHIPPGW